MALTGLEAGGKIRLGDFLLPGSRGFFASRRGAHRAGEALAGLEAGRFAAALMAQRPPCDMLRKRPRKDALLEAKRSHQRARIAGLDEKLLDETLRCGELKREQTSPPAGGRPQQYH